MPMAVGPVRAPTWMASPWAHTGSAAKKHSSKRTEISFFIGISPSSGFPGLTFCVHYTILKPAIPLPWQQKEKR